MLADFFSRVAVLLLSGTGFSGFLNPKPSTLNLKPSTLNPKLSFPVLVKELSREIRSLGPGLGLFEALFNVIL